MQQTACITGADRGLGLALCKNLLERGWRVIAGQYMPEWTELAVLAADYPNDLTIVALDVASTESVRGAGRILQEAGEQVDLLISSAGILSESMKRPITELQDYDDYHRLYDVNALGSVRVMEAFLPLLGQSAFKRLCFVSSEAGSIARSGHVSWYSYCMSKAALNMAVKILFNHLHPEGYTFRVYHPGWIRSYMSGSKNMEADLEPEDAAEYALQYFLNPVENEDELVMRDYQGNEWPW